MFYFIKIWFEISYMMCSMKKRKQHFFLTFKANLTIRKYEHGFQIFILKFKRLASQRNLETKWVNLNKILVEQLGILGLYLKLAFKYKFTVSPKNQPRITFERVKF